MPQLPLWEWITPGVLLWIALIGVAYAWLFCGPARDLLPGVPAPTRRQALSFYGALLMLYLSIGSPLGVLAMGYLFTAHMVQHMLAAIAVPPLLILGLPTAVWRSIFAARPWGKILRRLARPIPAILAFNGLFAALVYPPLIIAMVHSMALMVVMHVILVLVGLLVWWPLVSPLPEVPRLRPVQQILYLFGNSLAMILPLALVLLGPPLYAAAYIAAPHLSVLGGLGELGDQQLGAAVCLTGIHTVYMGLAIVRFYEWAHLERRAGSDAKQSTHEHLPVARSSD